MTTQQVTTCDECGKEQGALPNAWMRVSRKGSGEIDICSYTCLAAFGVRKQGESSDHVVASLTYPPRSFKTCIVGQDSHYRRLTDSP